MKVLATLALIAAGLTLSSCACKNGKCAIDKKKGAECCSKTAKPNSKAAAACCSH